MDQATNDYTITVGDMQLQLESPEYNTEPDGARMTVENGARLRSYIGTLPDGSQVPVYVEDGEEEHECIVYVRGEVIRVQIETPRDKRLQTLMKSAAGGRSAAQLVTAPMPGLLKQMLVSEGDVVKKGQSLCILEAMKMENEIKSPADLLVKRIRSTDGAAVEKGAPLLELAPVPEKASGAGEAA